jgi:metallo-beta-lactamase family protein
VRITFLGAAGTVTGSKYLVEAAGRRVLVDCGLFQGLKHLRLRNREPFAVRPGDLDAVVLTHAHLDHTGYLPLLVRDGFRGTAWCTAATRDLCGVILPDSGHLQEEEAGFANRHGYSRHRPALPLYTRDDAQRSLERLRDASWGWQHEVAPGVAVRFHPAGHLLGAAMVELRAEGRTVLFSGDLGRADDPLLPPPSAPPRCDALVVESTYGDRLHGDTDPAEALADAIERTAARGGVVLIPSFAVGRAQSVLYHVHRLKAAGRIPDLPVFLDSPMAVTATEIFRRHPDDHRLPPELCAAVFDGATVVRSVEESKRIDHMHFPRIVVSASGMATGGRVLHHLKVLAPDPRNLVLFAGYQAAGTRGAAMVAGADAVKIHGQYVPVRAEVRWLDALSSHADREELLAWAGRIPEAPRRVLVTHGEPVASDALRLRMEERFGWSCSVPGHRDQVVID